MFGHHKQFPSIAGRLFRLDRGLLIGHPLQPDQLPAVIRPAKEYTYGLRPGCMGGTITPDFSQNETAWSLRQARRRGDAVTRTLGFAQRGGRARIVIEGIPGSRG